MPQLSLAHAVARVRVLEGKLLHLEQIERLLQAPTLQEAYKLLEEYGYGPGSDYETALRQARQDLCAFLREVSPNQRVTDAFLCKTDYQNAKLLLKGRMQGLDASGYAVDCGAVALKTLQEAVEEKEYHRLPKALAEALREAETELNLHPEPGRIDLVLDARWPKEAAELSKGCKTAQGYFLVLFDLTNLRSMLRAAKAGMDGRAAREQLLPGGEVDEDALVACLGEPAKLLRLYEKQPYYRALQPAFEQALQGGLYALEKLQDDVLLGMLRQKRHETVALEPLLGYFVAREREMEMLRLVMAAKVNDFSQEAVLERLREMYVE